MPWLAAAAVTVAAVVATVPLAFGAVTGVTSVDPDTTNNWSSIAASSNSTQNVGRIWTDKSVFDKDYQFEGNDNLDDISKGDSDFLVGLSALSSTSNLKTTTTTSKPLDIVLVVDTSGSMDNSDGHDMGYSYNPTYDVRNNRDYYIQLEDGQWIEVSHNNQGWYYGSYGNRTYVNYMRWEGDTQGDRVQFYTRSNQQMSRMEALQNAANAFVDSVAAMNDDISDTAQQHRISLVKFASDENNAIGNGTNWDGYNYSQVVSDLTAYTTQTASTLKNTINSLEGEGATRADYGMHQAQRVLDGEGNLTGAREDAQKVVIFFTDGYPTTSSSWSNSVAGTAINYAYDMKQDGALVYSIGVFDEANPSDMNNNFNRYMNAVSSNYPNAECADNVYVGGGFWDPQYEWQQTDDYSDLVLGDRAEGAEGEENPQYYFAASNSDELNQVFDDITTSITDNAGSGSPIEEVRQEGALNPGTLTFTDTLGSYMTVSGDTMTVVYGDQEFKSTRKTTDGDVDTYHFEGTVAGNAVYKEADLSELTVTVTRSNDLATGDVVTVQVPASLIPMRHYDVDTDAKTMTVTDAYPIRLFYGVSVKADARNAVNQGSGDTYDAIVQTNKADDGTVAFYSNLYNSGTGDTTATFTPSDGNKFYYYTSKTNLYVDQNCTIPATRDNIDNYNTLYYSEPYWQTTSGSNVQEVTRGVAIERTGDDWDSIQYEDGWNGAAYIPAGTQRLDRPATLNSDKTENVTQTAATVLTPSWEDAQVSQHLGNNGKMTFPLPGQLEIKKSVDWGNASDETKAKQNNFEFTVNFNGDETLTGNFTYNVYEAGEDPVSTGTVADGGTISLTANQRAVISGLPSGTTFTVTETDANQNGFTTTDSVTANPDNVTTDGIASGTIVGGDQQSVAFQNNYKADEPLTVDTADYLNVKKELNGRDWRASDEFTFNMQSVDMGSGVVAPEDSSVTITEANKDQAVSFGDIEFTTTGTFRYIVTENNEDQIVGIDYSSAQYRLEITIGDAGNGNLKVDSYKLERLQNDEGSMTPGQTESVEGDTVTFVNNYTPDAAPVNIDGVKNYTDNSGDNSIINNKFQFQMEALGGYVTDGGSRDQLTISADDTPKPTENTQGNVTTIGNTGNAFHMPTISYTGDHVGNTYVYRITEVRGTEEGMIYDKTSYEVEVTVTEEAEPTGEEGQAHIEATVNKTPQDLVFTNTYDPTDATLKPGDDAIHGTKTLNGRAMQEGETFYFQLTALNDSAKTVLPNATTVAVTDPNSMDFDFGQMTFTKVGRYTFQVNEVANDQGTETIDGDGMTFDTNIATVTVDVTLNKDEGKLEATVSYVNDNHADVNDHAQFTNVYEANMNYGAEGAGGIAVTKKMVDRSMAAGDFDFTLTGTGPDGEITENFENTARAANSTVTMKQLQSLSFDEQDAGKTFSFTVDEAEGSLPGVVYDQSQYRVDITVFDNHDGSMHTETTVTKTMNADGTEANEVVIDKLNSDTAQGQVPTFGFENTYKPTEAKLEGDTALQVTKEVTGAPSPKGVEYSFTLTPQDTAEGSVANIGGLSDGKLTAHTTGVINEDAQDGTDDDTQTVPFGTLTFSKSGTYTFTVQENVPDALDGWTYDTNPKTITVVVTDRNEDNEYDGKLYIASVTPEDPVVVTNSYKAESITTGEDGLAKLQVTKAVTGAPATEEFTFELTPAKDYGDKVEGLKDGKLTVSTTDLKGQEDSRTLTFGDLTFNAEGTYTFDVKETNADPAEGSGWTYDNDAAKQITVVVTDENHDGKLDATTVVDGQDTNDPTFTNAYVPAEITTGADADTAIQVTKKVTGRDATEAFDFSLTLKEGQNADAVFKGKGEDKTPFDGMELTTSKDIKAGKTETKSFGDITFTEAGDYTFVIDETTTTTAGGWTYDDSTHEVTVHVTDDGKGALHIESIDGNDPTFENVYKLQPAKFRAARFMLQGNKVLDGRTWETGDEFTFTLTPGRGDNVDGSQMSGDEVTATMPASTSDTIRPADGDGSKVTDNSAQFTFTDERFPGEDIVGNEDDVFTYTKPGTYRYLIRETNPNVSNPGSGILGVSYDQTVYRLTVKVTDNGDGTMSAEGSYTKRNADGTWTDLTGSNEVTFTNKYSSDEVDITFNAFKVLQNRDQNMKDGEFTFHMEFAGWAANDANADPNDDSAWTMDDTTKAPAAAADTGNIIRGDVTFDGMTFTKDNVGYTYRYKITENPGDVPGVTYDTSAKYVTAKVTSVSTPDDPQDPDGAYTEHVRVETSGEAEWNEQAGTAPTAGAIFTNTYQAGAATGVPADFSFTKQFVGHEWTDNYSFEFTLAAQDSKLADDTPVAAANVPMPTSATKTVNTPGQEGGDTATFDFGSISYDKAGTYNYTVTEKNAGQTIDGITYDAQPAQVTVTVTEGKDESGALTGQLVATATVTNGDFVNEYHASASYKASGVGGLDITKQLNNHEMADDQFRFTIEAADEAAAQKLGIQDGLTTTVTSAAAAANTPQSVKSNPFDTIVFNEKDDGVTYTYTITENTDGVDSHYKTDDTTYTVSITPTDNGDGTMTVKTVVNGAETTNKRATVAFVNSYQADPTTVGAEGAATITGTKTLKNDTLTNGQFTFQVKSGDVVVAEGTNDANGKITFGDITYNTENLAAAATVDGSDKVGKATVQTTAAGTEYTFTYTVSEVAPATDSGVTASTAAQNVTITVTDDGNGTLTPVVTYGDGDPLAFENVYGGDAEFALDIAGTKKIVGAQDNLNVPQLTADAYQFTITGNPAADGTPAPMPAVTTVGNDASGNVTFGDIVYTMENTFGSAPATAEAAADAATDEGIETYTAGRTQVFTYTISESGTVAGVTNEQGTKTVQVTVTDLGGGKIKAEVTSDKTAEGADFGFTNVYDVKPEDSSLTGNGGFTITKDFSSTNTDRTLVEGEYEFQLKSGDDVVATASNDAAGNVSFGSITFTKPGTYNYTLSEVNGGKPGVTYDQTVYNVTAKVEDNGDGTLMVTWEMPQAVNNGVAFSNTYTAADANITLKAAKVLNGRALADGEFTFELRENGTVLDTATNDATGQVTFDAITYSEPGEHDYEIVEVAGNEANMTYDTTVHTVHVSVTDNTETGSLAVAWNYGETGEPVFTNTYTEPVTPSEPSGPSEPAKPADNLPVTGDYTLPIVGGIVVAGAALILGGRAIRKRGE